MAHGWSGPVGHFPRGITLRQKGNLLWLLAQVTHTLTSSRPKWTRFYGASDNDLAKSLHGSYHAEVIHRQRWKNRQGVELATLDWVDGFSNRRLLERIGYVPPVDAEQ